MAGFQSSVAAFAAKVQGRNKAIYRKCTEGVRDSMKHGSEVTGAPGVPVVTSNLINSYLEEDTGEWEWKCTTKTGYAKAIEDGEVQPHSRKAHERQEHYRGGVKVKAHKVKAHSVRGYKLFGRTVGPGEQGPNRPYANGGGPHSIKLTRYGWPQIVEAARREVVGE